MSDPSLTDKVAEAIEPYLDFDAVTRAFNLKAEPLDAEKKLVARLAIDTVLDAMLSDEVVEEVKRSIGEALWDARGNLAAIHVTDIALQAAVNAVRANDTRK